MIGQHVPNTLPITLNIVADDVEKLLRGLGQLPHNTVRTLYDSIAAQASQQVNAHIAAATALNAGVATPDGTVGGSAPG